MAKETSEDIDLDDLDDFDIGDADLDLDEATLDGDLDLPDFDGEDSEDGMLELDETEIDSSPDMDPNPIEDIDGAEMDIGDTDGQDTADSIDGTLDLSSLENELGLEESDRIEAPEFEEIKDVESDDELERELANLGNNIETHNVKKKQVEDGGEIAVKDSLDLEDMDIDDISADLSLDDDALDNLDTDLSVEDDSQDDGLSGELKDDVPSNHELMSDLDENAELDEELSIDSEEEFSLDDLSGGSDEKFSLDAETDPGANEGTSAEESRIIEDSDLLSLDDSSLEADDDFSLDDEISDGPADELIIDEETGSEADKGADSEGEDPSLDVDLSLDEEIEEDSLVKEGVGDVEDDHSLMVESIEKGADETTTFPGAGLSVEEESGIETGADEGKVEDFSLDDSLEETLEDAMSLKDDILSESEDETVSAQMDKVASPDRSDMALTDDDAEGEIMLEVSDDVIDDSGDLFEDESIDEESMVLDESMEVQEIDPQKIREVPAEMEIDLAIESEEDLDMFEHPEATSDLLADSDDLPEDSETSVIEDTAPAIELDEMPETNDLDLSVDLFGDESVDESMIEISELEEDDSSDFTEDFHDTTLAEPSLKTAEAQAQETKKTVAVRPEEESYIIGKEMLFNLPHELTVEIGKASMKGEDITKLTYGSIIELDKKIGEPVDIILGKKMIAKGEVVQINEEQLGVRITRINY